MSLELVMPFLIGVGVVFLLIFGLPAERTVC